MPPAPRTTAHTRKNRRRSRIGEHRPPGEEKPKEDESARYDLAPVAADEHRRERFEVSKRDSRRHEGARSGPPAQEDDGERHERPGGTLSRREEAGQKHESAGAGRDRSPCEKRHPLHPGRRDAEAGRGGARMT